jgi:hypothetical protein
MWKEEMKVIESNPGEEPLEDNLVLWEVDEAIGERRSKISMKERSLDYCWSMWKVKSMKDHVIKFVIIIEIRALILFVNA